MTERKMRLQIAIVRAVYRAERRRLDAVVPTLPDNDPALANLRAKCRAILDDVRSTLDGGAPWHPGLLLELDALETELG